MNDDKNPVVHDGAEPTISRLRVFSWSLRKELWEHRSAYLAPLVIAAFLFVANLFAAQRVPGRLSELAVVGAAKVRAAIHVPYSVTAFVLLSTMCIVGFYYCTDALHAERRDRSILFWKSLPVSDAVMVLAKFSVPMVVLPMVTWCLTAIVQCTFLIVSAIFVLANGADLDALWKYQPMHYHVLAIGPIAFMASLWFAPVYAWLLFISASVKRGVFLWAVMPIIALIAIEKIVFKSSVFTEIIQSRLVRFSETNTTVRQVESSTNLATKVESGRPRFAIDFDLNFFTNFEVWTGLVIAVILLLAATHMRRRRDPI